MLQFVDDGCRFSVILHLRPRNIHNHVGLDVLDLGIDVVCKIVHALVLKPHRIQHPHGSFCHARIRVSLPRQKCGSFDDDSAYIFQIDEILKLQSITECTRCRHHRIRHIQLANVYA